MRLPATVLNIAWTISATKRVSWCSFISTTELQ